jgi:HD-GYP domain-containing protein (c-di-GMP phosphodiesterase class II)
MGRRSVVPARERRVPAAAGAALLAAGALGAGGVFGLGHFGLGAMAGVAVLLAALPFTAVLQPTREPRSRRRATALAPTPAPLVDDLRARVEELEEHRAAATLALREAHRLAAMALAKTLALHDPVTGSHIERLPEYTRLLTTELARHPRYRQTLLPALLDVLPQASTLHDVGKLGIPEQILRKSGRLTVQEYAIMKRHTTAGGRTLQELAHRSPQNLFLAVGREVALYHHERWDGRGYPFGLHGTQIPLVARIVAVADVYDALTSERPYKGAYSHDTARRVIVADAGAHFDPDVVEAFLSSEAAFFGVSERHSRVAQAAAPSAQLADA